MTDEKEKEQEYPTKDENGNMTPGPTKEDSDSATGLPDSPVVEPVPDETNGTANTEGGHIGGEDQAKMAEEDSQEESEEEVETDSEDDETEANLD